MKIKTADLTGAALDWAVAKALGIRTYIGRYEHTLTGPCILDADLVDMQTDGEQELKYSRSWAQGGPIIEREELQTYVANAVDGKWCAKPRDSEYWDFDGAAYGPTPLIAAMRCYAASKLGDEVDVPEELL